MAKFQRINEFKSIIIAVVYYAIVSNTKKLRKNWILPGICIVFGPKMEINTRKCRKKHF
jgi:hypothetical protein